MHVSVQPEKVIFSLSYYGASFFGGGIWQQGCWEPYTGLSAWSHARMPPCRGLGHNSSSVSDRQLPYSALWICPQITMAPNALQDYCAVCNHCICLWHLYRQWFQQGGDFGWCFCLFCFCFAFNFCEGACKHLSMLLTLSTFFFRKSYWTQWDCGHPRIEGGSSILWNIEHRFGYPIIKKDVKMRSAEPSHCSELTSQSPSLGAFLSSSIRKWVKSVRQQGGN